MAFFNPKSVLLLDSCRAHITPEIKCIVSKYSRMAVIPGGLTKKLQPLDIAVNKPFKEDIFNCGNCGAKEECKNTAQSAKAFMVAMLELNGKNVDYANMVQDRKELETLRTENMDLQRLSEVNLCCGGFHTTSPLLRCHGCLLGCDGSNQGFIATAALLGQKANSSSTILSAEGG
ncbi:hypothetical protein J437_LFUL018808 [Ladona fulva]|uniref:DDE-1 domain-containing protein n=1 Tax=Ladona fulva TaxID=123851 RepID=A0A8K0KPX4_LADFU|nr:hypothetical protein J437_LFUL018808 [Ladona fulva]